MSDDYLSKPLNMEPSGKLINFIIRNKLENNVFHIT